MYQSLCVWYLLIRRRKDTIVIVTRSFQRGHDSRICCCVDEHWIRIHFFFCFRWEHWTESNNTAKKSINSWKLITNHTNVRRQLRVNIYQSFCFYLPCLVSLIGYLKADSNCSCRAMIDPQLRHWVRSSFKQSITAVRAGRIKLTSSILRCVSTT